MNSYKYIVSKIHKDMQNHSNYFVDFNSSKRSTFILNILRMVREDVFNDLFNRAYKQLIMNSPYIHELSVTSEKLEVLQKDFYNVFLKNVIETNPNDIFKVDLKGLSDFYFIDDEIAEVITDSNHFLKEIFVDLMSSNSFGDVPEYLELVIEDVFMELRRENKNVS